MATQSYQQRSDSPSRTSAPKLGRPFVVPVVQTQEDSSEQVQAVPDRSVSLLTSRYQVSASSNYQPHWIARAQTMPETAEPEETEEKVEETVQRSIDGALPETPSDPEDDLEDVGVQTKLTVGQPNDRYEQEADRVAEQVMSMPDAKPTVQREELPGEEEELQTKSLGGAIQREAMPDEEEGIQAKPLVSEITPLVQREVLPDEAEELQMKPIAEMITPIVQREAIPEEDEGLQLKAIVQREELPEDDHELQTKSATNQAAVPTSSVEAQLNNSKGNGSPLPSDVRSFMEPRFGTDFSGVRVHTGSESVQMNKELHAQAFAHGSDVYYGAGKAPGNDALTAHELTHVVQQTGKKSIQQKGINHDRIKPNLMSQGPVNISRKSAKTSDSNELDAENTNKEKSYPKAYSTTPSETIPKQSTIPSPQSNPVEHQRSEASPIAKEPASNAIVPFPSTGTASQNKSPIAETKALQDPATPGPANLPSPAIAQPQDPSSNLAAQRPSSVTTPVSSSPTPAALNSTGAIGSAPAIDLGSSGGESEAPAVDNAEDPALAAVAQATAGVELPTDAKSEAAADLSAIGAEGGEAPAAMGGGGGGAAIADKPAPTAPDVSQSEDPAQALATIATLPPTQLQSALGGVGAAVGKSVAKEQTDITNNLPQLEVGPDGSDSAAAPAPTTGATPKAVEKAPAGPPKVTPEPKPLPSLPAPVKSTLQPTVQGGADGKLSSQDVQNLKSSLNQIPTKDPAAATLKAPSPPPLPLEGDANPQQVQEQKAKLDTSIQDSHNQAQKDAAQPLGEDQIKATVPKELIKADPIGEIPKSAGSGPPVAAGGELEDGISIVAQEKNGPEIQGAVAQAQGQMGAERQNHQSKVAQEKQKSQQDIAQLQASNTQEKNEERLKTKTETDKLRGNWTKEQNQLVTKSQQDANQSISKANQEVQTEQTQSEAKAQEHIDAGNQKADDERIKGEQQADTERQKGKEESGGSGFFSWLADRAKAFFDGIKQAIQQAFEAARAAIKAAIETAQKLATAVIEAGRKAIVGIIHQVGEALIALGDRLLAAFPELRDRFRKLIQDKIKQAEDAVNRIADNLKKNVKAALDLLSKGLNAVLGLLEKGMMAAVDIVNKAVQGAIAAAKAAVDMLGMFALLIKDIAANPGQWLSNLAAGVMDGIKNHLWGAFQTAIKEWFNQKLESVLGIGMTIWNVLKQGGINFAEVGTMAWEGIKSAIPPALVAILVEKLVAMIVPAAGAVMAVIEGLQAAWGTVQQVLQAMERFVAFLKAVKAGASGPSFGQLLAAAGVMLVDFVSNWLLKRVSGAASKVAEKIKAIAQKIGAKLKGAFGKLKKGAGKLKDNFFGKKDGKGDKGKPKAPKSLQEKEKAELDKKQKKVDRAVVLATTAVNSLPGNRVGKALISPVLTGIKSTFGLKSLEPVQEGEIWVVHGEINPKASGKTKKKADTKVGWEKGQVPCFPAGTLVSTLKGMRTIESLVIGDQVYAYDFQSKSVAIRQILSLYHGATNCWVDIYAGSSILRATKDHPVWIESEHKWIEAQYLANGMTLRLENDETCEISSVKILPLRTKTDTYNLTIEGSNNFFAGEIKALVHNNNSRMNRKGYKNYVLKDKNGTIYYSGMFGPNQNEGDVERRHSRNNDRFSDTDTMVVLPGARTYKESRKVEHETSVKHGTFIGKKGESYRGNRQYPMDDKSFKRYYKADAC
jgi:hypothetical protein